VAGRVVVIEMSGEIVKNCGGFGCLLRKRGGEFDRLGDFRRTTRFMRFCEGLLENNKMKSSGAYDNAQEYFPGAVCKVGKDSRGLGILLSHIP
jgi:hypothetical protein